MARYRKLPIEIEAQKWEGNKDFFLNADKYNFFTEAYKKGKIVLSEDPLTKLMGNEYLYIVTLEGTMKANIGDYVIKGVTGEYYPCKPDIFEKTYERVEVS
jgi:hypothetical protein